MITLRSNGADRRRSLLQTSAILLVASFGISAADAATGAAPSISVANGAGVVDAGPDDIVVTGTRTARTVADSSVPIDVVDTKQLQSTGKLNIRDALQEIIPSYYNASGWTGGTGEAVKSASLRGLSSDQTLILVNGKRRHNHAVIFVTARGNLGASPVDLDLIPAASIQRIEVLRDGAAAQYGSDAIAGVINIIQKKGGNDGSASITYGQYLHHDGIPGKTGQQGQLQLDQGFNIGENGGFIRLSTNVDLHDYTNGLGATAACNPALRAYTCLYAAGDPREATANRYRGRQGLPQGQTYDFGYNAELPLSPDVTLYSFTTYSHQYSQNFGIYRAPSGLQNLPSVYPEGYLPEFKVITDDAQGVIGVRGTTSDWHWDLSSSYSRVKAKLRNDDGLNPSLGDSSPHNFYLGALVATEWVNNLDVTRDIDTGLFAKPLAVSFGAEYRRDHFEQRAGDPGSYVIGDYVFPTDPTNPDYIAANAGKKPSGGASGLGGFAPTALGHGTRDNVAGYVDLDQQVTSRWDLGIAGRFEHYSDVGNTWSGKISTRYELFRGFALRGSFSNGFRAPSLQQETYQSILPNYVQQGTTQVLSTIRYIPSSSTVAKAIGATPLRPERSRDVSVGFTAQPVSRLNITLDAYQINISHRILATGNLITTNPNSPFAQALVGVGANPVDTYTYFTNAANTRTRGIDFVADYTTNFGAWGKVRWSLSNAYNHTTITSLAPTPAVLSSSGLTVFDRGRIGDLTKAYPKEHVILGGDWQIGKFDLNVRENWYSKTVFVDPTTPNRDSTNKSAFVTDAELTYQVTPRAAFTLGANNLFNKFPSQLNSQAKIYYGWFAQTAVYNLTSPYGYNGGYYYARLTLNW